MYASVRRGVSVKRRVTESGLVLRKSGCARMVKKVGPRLSDIASSCEGEFTQPKSLAQKKAEIYLGMFHVTVVVELREMRAFHLLRKELDWRARQV